MPNNFIPPSDAVVLNDNASFVPPSDAVQVKKKESTSRDTGLSSKPQGIESSSVTRSKKEQKPSGSSVSGKPEGLYSFPGNELAVYKKTTDGWYVDPNKSGNFIKIQKGDVKSRIDRLEKSAKKIYDPGYEEKINWQPIPSKEKEKKKVPTVQQEIAQEAFKEDFFVTPESGMSSTQQVDFVSKEKAKRDLGKDASLEDLLNLEQKYKSSETLKMLNRKGYDVDINGSINDPKSKKALAEFNAEEDFKLKSELKKDKLSKSIDNIVNSKQMGLTEESTVPLMNKQFGKYGFSFEESGMGDAMKVSYSSDGVTYTDAIDIDLQSSSPEEQASILKSFMNGKYLNEYEVSALNDEKLDVKKLVNITSKDPYRYGEYMLTEGEFENYITKEYRNTAASKRGLDEKINKFEKLSLDYKRTGDDSLLDQMTIMQSDIKSDQRKLAYSVAEIEQTEMNYKQSVGSYILQKEKQGNFVGGIFASLSKGVTATPRALMNVGMDILPELLPNNGLNPLEYQNLKDEGFTDAEIGQKVSSKLKRTIGEEVKQGINNIGSLGTVNEEYFSSVDRNILEQAVFGLAESVGASVSGGGNKVAQGIAFFNMSYNSMADEMADEQFDVLNKWEKNLVSGVYGLAIGQLEKIGFNIASGQVKSPFMKKFTSNVVLNALKGMPENASIETVDQLIGTSLKNTMKAAGVKIVNGMLSEGTTEGIQSLAETGIKNVVSAYHDGKVFDYVPDLTTKKGLVDALGSALEEAAAGAIGGAVMGSFDVYKKSRVNEQSDEKFQNMYQSLTDSNTLKAVKLNEIEKYKNGSITKEEMQSSVRDINNTVGLLDKIPAKLSTRGKRVAFELLSEKEGLEKEIAGKDENLVAVQKARVVEINNELKNISENATKESNIQEVTAEGGVSEYQGAGEGQQEVGVGEGIQRDTTVDETNIGDSNIPGEVQEEVTAKQVINRPSTLSEFGGVRFDKPLQGDTYIEGQQVVFEDRATGRVYELGNVDEVMDSPVTGLNVQPETVSVTNEGKISVDGSEWNIQAELPTMGIEYNPAGEVKRVSLKDDNGNTTMFDGQKAVDIAYQIELQKIQSPEQQQLINDLLEQDEEFKSATADIKLAEAPVIVQEEAAPDTQQAAQQAEVEAIQPTQEAPIAEKVKPTIEQEVEAIGQLLSGTDQEIDQKASTIVNKKLSKAVARAAKAVSKVIPGTKFIVHDTDEFYREATKEKGMSQSSNGEFNPKTNTIHINGTKANNRTVAHEVFHAILLNKVKTDANASATTKRMVQSIASKIDDNPELKKKLEDFISNYEENIQNEEKVAELVGMLSENYNSFTANIKDIISRWIDKLAKIFNLDPFNRNETYDMLNTIARKVAKGKVISEADVNPLIQGVNGKISVSEKVDKRKSIVGNIIRFDINNNTKTEENIPLSRFNGKKTNVFESDRMTGGYIADKTGAVLFNFLGGVQFPAITGKWWASKSAEKAAGLAKNANSNRDADGYIYGTPMVGSDKQHMSNNDMLVATLELMKLDANSIKTKINKLEIIRLINKAFETKNVKLKKPILFNVIKKSNNVSNIFNELEYVLFQDGKYIVDRNNNPILDDNGSSILNLTFDDRKAIVETLLGNASVRDVNFPSAGNTFEAAKRFEEPVTKKVKKIGDVVTVMRTKGTLKWKKTETTDEFYHKSYPYEIYAENPDGTIAEIEMFILDSAYSMRDIFPSLTKSSGESFTWYEYFKKHGPKSEKVAEAQYNRTAKLSYASGEIKIEEEQVSNRKQIVGKNANLSQNVRDNLQVARNMETANKSVKDIRIATGWERGADNKWRYEIIDGKLKVPIKSIDNKLFNLLDSDELFNMYPQLKNINVKLRLNGIGDGSYSSKGIIVNGGKNDMLLILLHEVQHAIQSIERFARGGNVEMMKTTDEVLQNLANQLPVKKLTKAERSLIKDEYEKNRLTRLPILPTYLDVTSDSENIIEDFIDKLDVLVKLFPNETSYKNLQDALDLKLMEIGGKNIAFEKYQKIAGEVESRNVEARMKMTPEERRATTLKETEDISREDQIIFFDKKVPSTSKQLASEVAAIEDLFASRKQKTIKVYHGGNVKDLSNIDKDNPLFVSEDKTQAEEYTKENKGTVSSFEINEDGITNEDTVYELINKLGLKSKEEGWDINDLNLFELLDPRFSTSLSNQDINKVYSELEKEGFGGIRFTDTNIKTLKQDIQNIVIFNTDLVIEEKNIIRKQKPNTINDIVRITKDTEFSDAAIREYLKQKGYTDKQATAAINEYNIKSEGIFVTKEGGVPTKITNSIRSLRRRMFSARAFLAKSIFAEKENKDAFIAMHLNIVDQVVKDFNRLYKNYKGDKDALVNNFDSYIRGDKDIELPEGFTEVANSMRNQIDGLSNQLISSGLVDADMAKIIKDNIGQYLTRSYEIFDNKNWKGKVEAEVRQKAINFLRGQYRTMAEEMAIKENMPVEDALDNLVNNRLDEMLTKDSASNFVSGAKLGSKDLSVLKMREDIPVEIRMLMGEYSDPGLNYAKTILKLSSLAANHKFLSEIKQKGMGVYFFEKNDPRRPIQFNTEIATEGSESMKPLNGLYTTKEMAEAFMAQSKQLNDFFKYIMKVQSALRYSKTILSGATHFKNVIGNLGFVWINGHVDPKELLRSYSIIRNDLKKRNIKQKRDKMNEYIRLGIVKQSAGFGEIMDMFKAADWDTAMASRLSNKKLNLLQKSKKFLLQGKKKVEDYYQAEDDFFKIVAYENELSRYSEALFNKPKDELTEDELKQVNDVVVEIVKNTYPTYDRIPEAIKMIRRSPLIGNFVSFQAESYRTAFNTIALAKSEIASKNPKIKVIGAKRIVGATTYLAAKSAIISLYSSAAGAGLTGLFGYLFDDEDEEEKDKDVRKFVAPWSKMSDLVMLFSKPDTLKYIDFSASDPHGGMKKVMNAFFQGEGTLDSFKSAMLETINPFIGEDMAVEAALSLKNNQDKYGNPIYNTEETFNDQLKKVSSYLYKIIEPGTISSVRRGLEAESKSKELIANLTGYRIYEVDINKQFGYSMNNYSTRIADAKKIYNSAYRNEKLTDAQKTEAYNKANKAVKKIYLEIADLYNSAERLGTKPEDLKMNMKEFGNMSAKTISEIQSRKIEPLKKKEEEGVASREVAGPRSGSRSGTRARARY